MLGAPLLLIEEVLVTVEVPASGGRYIATLASQLTVTTINLKVNGLSDVINKPVGIFEADVDNFKRFNLDFAVPLPWNDAQDEVNMIAQLRSGIVQALILDAPFVEYHAAESCDLYAVGEMLLPVNLAYAFPSDVPLDYIELFNQALTIMEEQGTMGDLQQQFITPPGGCPSKKSNVASSTISLQQVLPSADSVAGSVRNRSLINANPELSWLSVAEATTQEEAMEMMEGHVKVVDQRVKQLSEAIEHSFASLNEQLFGLAPEPVYQVAFTRKKSFSEKATDALATVFGSKTAQGSAQRLPSFGGNGDDAPEAVAVISLPSMPVKQQPSGSLTTTPSGEPG
ncbi:uncharacterized protein HaLaN_04807 [Haematococcus lacustris]|uniref:Solute-binding protein family 3/N-terminal domain-containing protein n=1 Tax=Haematococcus lacustris TaxID=44745 RepID=A0A699YTE2_HAELA|nr:uncharacterized protein HaLaN_04807 [Haematococcus lacustris]